MDTTDGLGGPGKRGLSLVGGPSGTDLWWTLDLPSAQKNSLVHRIRYRDKQDDLADRLAAGRLVEADLFRVRRSAANSRSLKLVRLPFRVQR